MLFHSHSAFNYITIQIKSYFSTFGYYYHPPHYNARRPSWRLIIEPKKVSLYMSPTSTKFEPALLLKSCSQE